MKQCERGDVFVEGSFWYLPISLRISLPPIGRKDYSAL